MKKKEKEREREREKERKVSEMSEVIRKQYYKLHIIQIYNYYYSAKQHNTTQKQHNAMQNPHLHFELSNRDTLTHS